jgi:hypothetical protein
VTISVRRLRPTAASVAYVLAVAVLATIGFAAGSTATILVASALALPVSLVAVPAYYVAYGLLALIPGANPDSASGSGSCTPAGECTISSTGDPAAWFTATTEVLGVLALVLAAVANVALLRLIAARRAPGPTPAATHGR